MDAAIDLIRSSPYQPRLYFDVEELKASIQNDGMLVAALVREKPGEKTRYEIIDGERRWRAAKELNWQKIPIEIRNVADETARRMVYTLNEERQPYTLEENTKFFRRMYDQMGSVYAVAEAFKRPQSTIWNYINVSILPEHFQKAVWGRKIPMNAIKEMEPVFTQARDEIGDITSPVKYQNSPSYQKLLAWCERVYTGEIKTPEELGKEYVDPYLEALDKARITKAKEELERIVPSHIIEATVRMETPEDYERAAETLRRQAQKRREEAMTPEERAALEAEKRAKLEALAVARAEREEERKQREEEEKRRREEIAMKKARQELKKDTKFIEEALGALPPEVRDELVYGEVLTKEKTKLEKTRFEVATEFESEIYKLGDRLSNIGYIAKGRSQAMIASLRYLQDKIKQALEVLTGQKQSEVEGIIEPGEGS